MMKIVPFLFFASLASAKSVSDFEGVYINRHSLYITSEDRTVHGVEDTVRIQPVNDKKANILVETYTQNYHSCQLIGEAELQGETLIFTSPVDKKLSRGKKISCVLKLTQIKSENGDKTLKIEDENENCKIRYCGITATLGGEFKQKTVQVQDKN